MRSSKSTSSAMVGCSLLIAILIAVVLCNLLFFGTQVGIIAFFANLVLAGL